MAQMLLTVLNEADEGSMSDTAKVALTFLVGYVQCIRLISSVFA